MLILLSLIGLCTAQTVSNIRSEWISEAGYYIITYDLSGKEGDTYLVNLVPYLDDMEVTNLTYVSGQGVDDVVSPSKNLKLYWHPLLEGVGQRNRRFRINTSAIPKNMIYVEGGSFMMGSNDKPGIESPIHKVTLSSFIIGRYQVTQKEWKDTMGSNPSYWKGDDLPVEKVSWYDAVEYCNKRSRAEGLTPCYSGKGDNIICDWTANGYRLPTEAEWEYAARGGQNSKGYKYSGSDNINTVAWYDGNSGSKTHAVGTKAANELGIYDMSGNVWEWCWDWYDSSYYNGSPASNPKGPTSGSYRVCRGGSWYSVANFCTVSYRYSYDATGSSYNLGFRIFRVFP